jgi:hypothetical protein
MMANFVDNYDYRISDGYIIKIIIPYAGEYNLDIFIIIIIIAMLLAMDNFCVFLFGLNFSTLKGLDI